MHDVKTEKVALRAEIRERRRIMPPLERSIAEKKLLDRMKKTVNKFQAKKLVATFQPMMNPPHSTFWTGQQKAEFLYWCPPRGKMGLWIGSFLTRPT